MARVLWIDGYDYAARLLRRGEDLWDRPQDIGMFAAEIIALLKPDHFFLPLSSLIQRHLAPQNKPAVALDDAVAEGKMLESLRTGLASLSATGAANRVVPVLPGATSFVGENVDPDDWDLAVTGLGDILRCIGQVRIVALDEASVHGLDASESLFRVGEHLGCEIVLLNHGENKYAARAFPVQGAAGPCLTVGLAAYADAGALEFPAENRDVRVMVAPDAAPETVLRLLDTMRSAGG